MRHNEKHLPSAVLPVYVETSPSLALIKYWGKVRTGKNIPATTSLAVTLEGLRTSTILTPGSLCDKVLVQGKPEREEKYEAVFLNARKKVLLPQGVEVQSENSFPTGAGIASSSSGFAALALGLLGLGKSEETEALLANEEFLASASRLACTGSVSASRAVYGGFTLLRKGRSYAEPLAPASYWDSLRIIVIVVSDHAKDVSSRNGMKKTQETSPYYKAWVHDAEKLSNEAIAAFAHRDLEKLGFCMRASYMRMHASAMASREPLVYWKPESLAVLELCAELRKEGFNVWETMDAGPQVKLLYDVTEEVQLCKRLDVLLATCFENARTMPRMIFAKPGGYPELRRLSPEACGVLASSLALGKGSE